jgi:hypothetical protein
MSTTMAGRGPGQYVKRVSGSPLTNLWKGVAIAMSDHPGRREDLSSSHSRNFGAEGCSSTGSTGHSTYKVGYPSFAEFVAEDTDNTGFVFRSFRVLVARSLLYMQSELIHLSLELEKHEANGLESDGEVRLAMRSWSQFIKDDGRRKLATDLSVKLKAYRTSVGWLTRLTRTNR